MALISLRQLLDHAAVKTHPGIPVVLHQDHGASPGVCTQSIRSGFTSVMTDGSLREDAKTPASYDYNIEVTRRVCDMAHTIGVSVEEDGVGAQGTLTHEITHLVMQGSSSVPQEWLTIIREHGGDIRETYGDTDIRLAMTGAAGQAERIVPIALAVMAAQYN
jgi:fructose/tagatose bisphosphate aldolase